MALSYTENRYSGGYPAMQYESINNQCVSTVYSTTLYQVIARGLQMETAGISHLRGQPLIHSVVPKCAGGSRVYIHSLSSPLGESTGLL